MESLDPYIAHDRRQAMARGAQLPDRASGAALFADISGFTPLTEALVRAFGPQRGAEELARQLNLIYDALIDQVEQYRGSVLGFSGDAITCWFDDAGADAMEGPLAPAALRATAAALAMQRAIQTPSSITGAGGVALAIKAAVTAGAVRRFLIGATDIQIIDVLAGETVQRLAAAEHQAEKGEVLIDEPAAALLGEQVSILAWRDDQDSGARFASVGALTTPVAATPWPSLAPDALSDDATRPWLLPPVYARLASGMGEFLTELRPAAALFLRFGGIDYDGDEQAQPKLDGYIQRAQRILARYDSFLLQLTIGDKGSYFYAAFGAPLAHEDDTVRAVAAALELRDLRMPFITDVQIGISQGRMRTGAYGSATRRIYGVLGDDVNMAARLMQHAAPGQALASQTVLGATANAFDWEAQEPLRVKGKAQPVTVFRLIAAQERRSFRLHEPKYALPMVGRAAELALIERTLELALLGRGQIVGITAEAGMGKSRLLAEAIRLTRRRQVLGYGGECQSYGANASYLVWHAIWRSFFALDGSWPAAEQIQALERQLIEIDPALLPRLPLLGAILNLTIGDNELTEKFDAKLRKESLEALLVDCLRARARATPLLLVLEDCHWLDPLSHDLLDVIGRAIADVPVLIVLAYRPVQVQRLLAPRVAQLGHFTEVALDTLPADAIAQLVRRKLGQIYGEGAELAPGIVGQISDRAQGNPFYIEELLNYLHDRGVTPQQTAALGQIELPTSLHSLILSRIDQLSENQKTLLKVASVIGRLFRAAMLWGVYTQFGNQERARADLQALRDLDLTPLDTPEPELAYLFKHILTQEVAYETLPFAMRATLHDQIGQYIERTSADRLDQTLDLLAYHYDRSENAAKQREYALRAGEAAQAAYANAAAISYYRRVLPLLDEAERVPVLLRLGQVLELVGEWQAADGADREAVALTERLNDAAGQAQAQRALGWLLRKRGEYAEAETWMASARERFEQLGDPAGVSRVLADVGEVYRLQGRLAEARGHYDRSLALATSIADLPARRAARAHALRGAGTVVTWQGDYAAARALSEESLALRRELGDEPGVAVLLNNLGIVARFQGDLAGARRMNAESLALFRRLGDRWATGQLLNNQACVASDQGDYAEARTLLNESLFIRRQIGDRAGLALSLNTLADVVIDEGDYPAARPLLDESLAISRELGDQTALAYLVEDYAGVAAAEARPEDSLRLAGFAAALRDAIGAPLPPAELARVERMIAPAHAALPERGAQALADGRSLTLDGALALAVR